MIETNISTNENLVQDNSSIEYVSVATDYLGRTPRLSDLTNVDVPTETGAVFHI